MDAFGKIVQRLSLVLVVLGGVCLMVMVVIVNGNIIGRATWGSILGAVELTGMMGGMCIAFAIGYTEYHRSHVEIPVLLSLFKPRVQEIIRAIDLPIAIIAALLIAVPSTMYLVTRVLVFHSLTKILFWPIAPFLIVWIIGLLFLCVMLVAHFIEAIRSVVKK